MYLLRHLLLPVQMKLVEIDAFSTSSASPPPGFSLFFQGAHILHYSFSSYSRPGAVSLERNPILGIIRMAQGDAFRLKDSPGGRLGEPKA